MLQLYPAGRSGNAKNVYHVLDEQGNNPEPYIILRVRFNSPSWTLYKIYYIDKENKRYRYAGIVSKQRDVLAHIEKIKNHDINSIIRLLSPDPVADFAESKAMFDYLIKKFKIG